jgi:hypothetical protein
VVARAKLATATDIKRWADIAGKADIVQAATEVVNGRLELPSILSIEHVQDTTVGIHR